MYTKYAERQRWKVGDRWTATPPASGGFKEVILFVQGRGAWSRLKFERGVHRVQRVPATESSGRIHTSTVTVAVLPEAEDVDVKVEEKDIRVDVYRSSGPGRPGRQHHRLRGAPHPHPDRARRDLPGRALADQEPREGACACSRRACSSGRRRSRRPPSPPTAGARSAPGERSERIRTYNFPQGRVTDHRIGLTLHRLPAVLEGDLDELIDGPRAPPSRARSCSGDRERDRRARRRSPSRGAARRRAPPRSGGGRASTTARAGRRVAARRRCLGRRALRPRIWSPTRPAGRARRPPATRRRSRGARAASRSSTSLGWRGLPRPAPARVTPRRARAAAGDGRPGGVGARSCSPAPPRTRRDRRHRHRLRRIACALAAERPDARRARRRASRRPRWPSRAGNVRALGSARARPACSRATSSRRSAATGALDLIVANPPYLPSAMLASLPPRGRRATSRARRSTAGPTASA